MTRPTPAQSVRLCGQTLRELVDRGDGDPTRVLPRFVSAIQRLLEQEELLDVGISRSGNHADTSRLLYYEPELMIVSGSAGGPWAQSAHNHGVWVATALYAGSMKQQTFRMLEQDAEGRARVELVEDVDMQPGDVCVCPPPPHDIHALESSGGYGMLVVAGGGFSPLRQYYDVARQSYNERSERDGVASSRAF